MTLALPAVLCLQSWKKMRKYEQQYVSGEENVARLRSWAAQLQDTDQALRWLTEAR